MNQRKIRPMSRWQLILSYIREIFDPRCQACGDRHGKNAACKNCADYENERITW